MDGDETRRAKEALSGGHLCHVCGHQYPNPNPSAKLRRSHRRNCGKMPAAAESGGVGVDEREEAAVERNANEGLMLGGGGGKGEGDGAGEANGSGPALRGSAKGDGDSVENKENVDSTSPNAAGIQVITTGCTETSLINCTSNASEIVDEVAANLPRSCTSESQNEVVQSSKIALLAVGHPAGREDSFDEYQDASPFLHQLDSEDGATVARESDFSIEINNLNDVSLGRSLAASEISLEMGMIDLLAGSKVGKEGERDSENRTPGLTGPEDIQKLENPDDCSVNIDSNNRDATDSKSDKTSGYDESIGDLNASSLQKRSPVISDSSRTVEGLAEDCMDSLDIMSEVSPTPELGSDSVGFETVTNSGTCFAPTGNELKLIHTQTTSTDCSTMCSPQSNPVEDTSDLQQPIEKSCLVNSVCSVVGYQNDLPVTNEDGMLKSIAEDNCSEGTFFREERTQQDAEKIVHTAEEKFSTEKPSGFSKDEAGNIENDPEAPTKYQVSTTQDHVTLLMDQPSCIKNPFTLDDTRSDDLFEISTHSYHLEPLNVVESKQQIDSSSLVLDQLRVSDQTSIAEGQNCPISDDRIVAVSSTSQNGYAVGAEDLSVTNQPDPTENISLHDASVNHSMQEGEAQIFPTELSRKPTSEEINAVSTVIEEQMQAKSTSEKYMTVEESIDNIEEKKQTEGARAKEMNAVLNTDNVEQKVAEDTSTEMNEVQLTDNVEQKKQVDTGAKEAGAVQRTENVEKCQAEDTGEKGVKAVRSMENADETIGSDGTGAKMDSEFNADNAEVKKQTNDNTEEGMNALQDTDNVEVKRQAQESIEKETRDAVQSTDNVEEKKQTEGTVGLVGNKQNGEIAAAGTRLNSGRIHVPLKVLLAEASVESKEKKTSTKERVLSFRRRASKDDSSSMKSGSYKSGSDDQYWNSPAKLPHNDVDKRSKGRKQPWMPFICCLSVH